MKGAKSANPLVHAAVQTDSIAQRTASAQTVSTDSYVLNALSSATPAVRQDVIANNVLFDADANLLADSLGGFSFHESKNDSVCVVASEKEGERECKQDAVYTDDEIARVMVQVFGVCTEALLDSGSRLNLIARSLVPSSCVLGTVHGVPRLRAANGEPLGIEGCVVHHVLVDGKPMRVRFVVISNLAAGILLGREFMREHGVALLFDLGVVEFRKHATTLSMQKVPLKRVVPEKTTLVVRVCERTVLDGRSERALSVYVDNPQFSLSSFAGFVSSCDKARHGAAAAHGVARVHRGVADVVVCNLNRYRVTLYEHDVVAVLQICNEADYVTLDLEEEDACMGDVASPACASSERHALGLVSRMGTPVCDASRNLVGEIEDTPGRWFEPCARAHSDGHCELAPGGHAGDVCESADSDTEFESAVKIDREHTPSHVAEQILALIREYRSMFTRGRRLRVRRRCSIGLTRATRPPSIRH